MIGIVFLKCIKWALMPLIVAGGYLFYQNYKSVPQDNVIEERIEDALCECYGFEIDLSPETPEK